MRMLMLGVVIGFLLSLMIVVVPIVFAQAPPLQEFIPLPGPGQQPDMRSPQQGQDDCQTILFYHNGRLYRLRPGQGNEQGQGRPGSPPEFFQLDPYQGPAIPGLPQQPDQGPNFTPVQPRS